jgi:anti-sigma regulatory factor (Ser/Thr protein kinase)
MASDRAAPPSGRWTMQLPKDLPAVRTARATVRRWLGDADPSLIRDARSVVTELVSNAVRYGEPPITMTLVLEGDRCRVEVVDSGARSWARRWPDDGGWGLRIIGRLAVHWGVDEAASCVWCELRARPAEPLAAGHADDAD